MDPSYREDGWSLQSGGGGAGEPQSWMVGRVKMWTLIYLIGAVVLSPF